MHRIFIAVVVALLAAGPVVATDTADVTSLLEQWVSSFNKGDLQAMAARCTEQSTIIDDFPPHAWLGTGACGKWATDFQNFAKEGGITAPTVTLGKPLHLDISSDRAYVVVPAKFAYQQKGKPVLENAIVTLALQKYTAGWYIAGWAWADH
jgi:ketosteroid isomerase-like protein